MWKPVPQGDNLTPAADGWTTSVDWSQGRAAKLASISVTKSLEPEARFAVDLSAPLSPDSMGFGNAINVSSPDVIVGYAVNNGANSNVMVYSLVSATSPAPEPSTLILVPVRGKPCDAWAVRAVFMQGEMVGWLNLERQLRTSFRTLPV